MKNITLFLLTSCFLVNSSFGFFKFFGLPSSRKAMNESTTARVKPVYKKYLYGGGGAALCAVSTAILSKTYDRNDSWLWFIAKSTPCFIGMSGGFWSMYRTCRVKPVLLSSYDEASIRQQWGKLPQYALDDLKRRANDPNAIYKTSYNGTQFTTTYNDGSVTVE